MEQKNASYEPKEEATNNQVSPAEDLVQTLAIDNALYTLYMIPKDFIDVFNNKGNKKVLFQFCLTTTEGSRLTLGAWPANDNKFNNRIFPLKFLHTWEKSTVVLEKNIFLGDQKLDKKEIDDVIAECNKPTTQFLIFDPKKNPDNDHIYYDIYASDKLEKDAFLTTGKFITSTNPSPPANIS